jgi:hypothetical protein
MAKSVSSSSLFAVALVAAAFVVGTANARLSNKLSSGLSVSPVRFKYRFYSILRPGFPALREIGNYIVEVKLRKYVPFCQTLA